MADSSNKQSEKSSGKGMKEVISFGRYHPHVQIDDEVKKVHELTQKEKELLIEDFRKLRTIEKEEEAELSAIKHFESKLQELIESVVYLEGYIQKIEEGDSMLRVNSSVKELGDKLKSAIEEVEKLSKSILDEEKKIMGLAKHVRVILGKAKRYQQIIFEGN